MDLQRILITGVPGTGKTTIGDYLEKNYDFLHVNLESDLIYDLLKDYKKFIADLLKTEKNIVITWGFVVNEEQTNIVKYFKQIGFKLFWFDADIETAKMVCVQRRGYNDFAFQKQMKDITEKQIVKIIDPIIINTFDNSKKHFPKSVLAELILK